MKHCPACLTRSADDVTYCATDGTLLVADAPAPLPVAAYTAAPTVAPAPPRGVSPVAAAALVVGTLVVCALAWLFVSQQQRADELARTAQQADARAAEAERQAADATQRARDAQLADAEARAEDAAARSAPPAQPVRTGGSFVSVAYADSPGDGYLALRSQPSTSTGRRLAQIPHGDQIALGACNPTSQVPGGRVGQWCRTRWGGMEGWAFTAFMQF